MVVRSLSRLSGPSRGICYGGRLASELLRFVNDSSGARSEVASEQCTARDGPIMIRIAPVRRPGARDRGYKRIFRQLPRARCQFRR
jgi:hypothetical protein